LHLSLNLSIFSMKKYDNKDNKAKLFKSEYEKCSIEYKKSWRAGHKDCNTLEVHIQLKNK